jgi:hypothetical protein
MNCRRAGLCGTFSCLCGFGAAWANGQALVTSTNQPAGPESPPAIEEASKKGVVFLPLGCCLFRA